MGVRQRGCGHPAVVEEAINGHSPGGLGISRAREETADRCGDGEV